MPDWSPHLFTAFKSLKQGDHAVAVGIETPCLKTLDHAVQLVRGNKAPTPRYFLFQEGDLVHFGEWGRLTERLGRDHPYCVDGPDMNGRPIKYFQSFSAPRGTPIPSRAWLEKHQDWFKEELDKLVRAFNELDDKERSAKLNKMACIPGFEEAYEYGDNFWDKMAQKINAGQEIEGVILPEIDAAFPDIEKQVKGIVTENSVKKNIPAHAAIHSQLQESGKGKMGGSSPASSKKVEKWSKTSKTLSWGRMSQSPALLVSAAIVASVGVAAGIYAWRKRMQRSALGQQKDVATFTSRDSEYKPQNYEERLRAQSPSELSR